ncbi:hypothetical protein BFP72_13010 [Reichenbachiella sp. 5M10]|nr:hypothetical protein BFP72_13010 [Reichenbachiella sp. 5M10]
MMIMGIVMMGCSTDDGGEPEAKDPIASFQVEIDEADFFEATFSNFSQNATSYTWDFGDEVGTSTEENPVYTYLAGGTYTVTLTAANDAGVEAEFSSDVTVTDPDEQLTLLSGVTSKTWKLLREGAALGIGPAEATWYSWWTLSNDGSRNCLFDDEFTYHRDGTFEYQAAGTFWGEADYYAESDKADLNENCVEESAANLTVDGVDYSAWLSSDTHSYEYSSSEGTITLTGAGAWMGLYKLGSTTYNPKGTTPPSSTSFSAVLADGGDSGVDTLTIGFQYEAEYWRAIYVSYANAADEPAMGVKEEVEEVETVIDAVNIDLESDAFSFGGFGSASPSIVDNPVSGGINTSAKVGQVDETDGAEGWSGISTNLGGKVDFSTKQTFKMKVYSPAAGTIVKFKLESSANAADNKEIDVTTTVANEWEELSFTFAAEDTEKWDVMALFFDFQTVNKEGARVHYFDDIILE